MKIIIRNLARETTQPELLALFQAHGRVQSCTIVMDQVTGGSKGFGFVNMPVPHEAKVAIRALNGLDLGGSRIRVKKAEVAKAGAVSGTQMLVEGVEPDAQAASGLALAAESGARIKKDGTPLGQKKPRVFRKKTSN